jgi:xyloglucan-specific exo-beta-1,4-glucanase
LGFATDKVLGGGFTPGIVFNPTEKGLAYARTDIGGLYRLKPSDDSWTPLQDYVNNTLWYILIRNLDPTYL